MHVIRLIPFLASLALVVPGAASAHGSGITFTATTTAATGEVRLIDVDYSDFTVYAGTFGRFDFKLFSDPERTEAVPFTDLWVRIEEERDGGRSKVFFAGPIAKADFGGTGFSIVFPEAGEYLLSVRYNDAQGGAIGSTLAEAEFPLTVVADPNAPAFYLLPALWAGFAAGLLLSLVGVAGVVARSRFSKVSST
jgi:hypothetical protein